MEHFDHPSPPLPHFNDAKMAGFGLKGVNRSFLFSRSKIVASD